MEKLLEILHEIVPDVDLEKEKELVEHGLLDSLSIVMLVSDLEDAYDVSITPVDIVPENFQSAETIFSMITRLQNEK